jgi:hypothetical protein
MCCDDLCLAVDAALRRRSCRSVPWACARHRTRCLGHHEVAEVAAHDRIDVLMAMRTGGFHRHVTPSCTAASARDYESHSRHASRRHWSQSTLPLQGGEFVEARAVGMYQRFEPAKICEYHHRTAFRAPRLLRNVRRVETVARPFKTVSIWCKAWSLSAAVFDTMQSAGAKILRSRM